MASKVPRSRIDPETRNKRQKVRSAYIKFIGPYKITV